MRAMPISTMDGTTVVGAMSLGGIWSKAVGTPTATTTVVGIFTAETTNSTIPRTHVMIAISIRIEIKVGITSMIVRAANA